MAKTTPDRIILVGSPLYKELPLEDLDVYGVGAITPGFLCERTSTDTVQPHSTAAGAASAIFAVESESFQSGTNEMGGIDDDYDQDGQSVLLAYCPPGTEVYALLSVGENVARGALLESNGDGALQAGTTNAIVRALEAKDNSGGSAAVRIKAEVL